MLVSVSIAKNLVPPNCVNNVRHIVVAIFVMSKMFFDVIQQCADGGRTKYCFLIFLHNI